MCIRDRAYIDAYVPLDELPENVAALYGHDVAAAQALLATTPYPNGFDCTVLCWDTPVMIDILSQYQAMLADININMELDVIGYADWTSKSRSTSRGPYEISYTTPAGNGTYMKMLNIRGVSSYNVSRINNPPGTDPVIEAAYQEMVQYAGIDELAMMEINRNLMPYLLEQAYVIDSPTAMLTNMWWPWLKNYFGCTFIGYYNSYSSAKYYWIDQDLKESMGY